MDFTGIEIIDARISELKYSPEIAANMLKRQQAQALIAARSKIVEGAVGMAVDAITKIEEKNIAQLTPRHKQELIAKLLIILSSDNNEN